MAARLPGSRFPTNPRQVKASSPLEPEARPLPALNLSASECFVCEALGRAVAGMHVVTAEQKDRPAAVLEVSCSGEPVSTDRDILAVPRGASAVLVLSHTPSRPSCHKLLGALRGTMAQASTPIVVLLLQDDVSLVDASLLSREARSLMQAGADDVILQPSCKAELSKTLALRAAVLGERRKQLAALRQQVEQHKEQGQMFWKDMDQIIHGFPKLDTTLSEDPKVGDEIAGKTLRKFVGRGGFGKVYSCTCEGDSEPQAMKVVPKTAFTGLQSVVSIFTECVSLQRLSHPNIVTCHGLAHGRQHLYLSMSFAGSRNLLSRLEECSDLPKLAWSQGIFRQVSSAIAHCHANDVVHRDIKPENVVLSEDGRATLVDFGLARPASAALSDACGSMPFVAPEVLLGGPPSRTYDGPAADVWSLGMLLLELVCGAHCVLDMLGWPRAVRPEPFRVHEIATFFGDDAATAVVRHPHGERLGEATTSEALREIVQSALSREPSARCSSAQVEALSGDEWAISSRTTTHDKPKPLSEREGVASDSLGQDP